MSYCISHMIGIRLGGVFSGKTDMMDLKQRIARIVIEMRAGDFPPDLGDKDGDVSHCLSQELESHKGSYAVIAGVFNYWDWKSATEFSRRLSEEFGVEVMHMGWNEECDTVQCQVYLRGKPFLEMVENPIGRILRRTM